MKLDVRIDTSGAERMLRQLQGEVRDTAMARTLSRVVDQGRTAMRREISREFNLSQSQVAEKLNVRKPRRDSGGVYVLRAELYSRGRNGGRSLNLIRFMEKQVSLAEGRRRTKAGTHGVYVKIKRTGSFKLVKGAFIGNKGRTVFRRVGKERLPIEALQTIDVPQMFNTRRVNQVVRTRMQEQLVVVAGQQLRYAIARVGGRR